MEQLVFIALAYGIVCGALASVIAGHKGQSSGAWFGAGFFFGIFGLIGAAGLPVLRPNSLPDSPRKKCPDCAEPVRVEALVCKHCGLRYSGESVNLSILQHPDTSYKERSAALARLAENPPEWLHDFAKKIIQDATPGLEKKGEADFVRQALFIALQNKSQALATEFENICDKEGQTFGGKSHLLIQALGDMAYPSTLGFLYKQLLSVDPGIVKAAMASLKKYGQAALPGLQNLASEGSRAEKKVYAKAVKEFGDA
jgi:hypothetical protein